ncbi:MAG: Gfo/Idh/MocA family oxidoreductase [bacterium]|nr:Gfo/Idh/MocA family oxidoreductase [bacterium]MDI1337646.1 Gfo/Idh/MocA family oxidoreductase [Lacunisphaera sp.]
MSQRLRIGIIGAGGNTRAKHIPEFKKISGVEVSVVCNRTMESSQRVAKEFGLPFATTSAKDVIESPDIDAICIGTWPNMHAKFAVAALRAGKHVLTEARMARNLAEAEMMLEESLQRPSLAAQIVPAPMSLPFDATIIEMLQRNTLGTVREVLLTATSDHVADSSLPLSWRQDLTLSGKNTLYMGIYYEMVLRWLGHGVTSVVADAAIFTKERKDEEGVPEPTTIPESVTVLGNYPDGARLIAHFSGVERSGARAEIRLNGSKAGLRLDLAKGELWLTRAGEPEQLVTIAPEKRGSWQVEADFVDSIRTGRGVRLTDFATGVKYMQFTEAVWDSWHTGGRRVTL